MKALALAALFLLVGGCAESLETAAAAHPAALSSADVGNNGSGSPVKVFGTIDGQRFEFDCMNQALNRGGISASSVVYGASGDIFVSCENAALGIEANTLIARPTLGANEGRVALSFRGSSEDVRPRIVTSDSAFVEIKEWNAQTRRVRGTSTMWCARGEVHIEYNVSARM